MCLQVVKHDQNKQMTEDVANYYLSIFYTNMECIVYFWFVKMMEKQGGEPIHLKTYSFIFSG